MSEKADRFNGGKNRLALIPVGPLWELGRVFTNGAKKYEARNWEKGLSYTECLDACLRHMLKFMAGHVRDTEIDCHHLACAIWNLVVVLHMEQNPGLYSKFDDIPQYPAAVPNDSNPEEVEP